MFIAIKKAETFFSSHLTDFTRSKNNEYAIMSTHTNKQCMQNSYVRWTSLLMKGNICLSLLKKK